LVGFTSGKEKRNHGSAGAGGVRSVDNSQAQVDANIQAQRKGFVRVVLAIIGFVFVWKITILIGCKTWGGGALNSALFVLFPTVYDWRSYERTKKFGPLLGTTFNFFVILVLVCIFNLAIELVGIPQ
jgi:hypothetical protein